MEVLDLFTLETPLLSLQEISERLGMYPSSTYRLLMTLEKVGMLARDRDTDRFRLGPKVLALGGKLLAQYPIRVLADPYLRRLAHDLHETAILVAYDGPEVLYLDTFEGTRAVTLTAHPGGRAPTHCVASGRALLAYQPPREIERVLALDLGPCASGRYRDADELRRELAAIRERGWSYDDGDYFAGVRAAAAPILDPQGRPAAAITVLALASHMSLEELETLGRRVREACDEISRSMGKEALPGPVPDGGLSLGTAVLPESREASE